jgi:hypothetical protein
MDIMTLPMKYDNHAEEWFVPHQIEAPQSAAAMANYRQPSKRARFGDRASGPFIVSRSAKFMLSDDRLFQTPRSVSP